LSWSFEDSIQKITPFLWFDGRAQEAAASHVSNGEAEYGAIETGV
jgi:predicted 3-demethylubiquinone-9 3-methyltransferase (glyoxalase superfamily)